MRCSKGFYLLLLTLLHILPNYKCSTGVKDIFKANSDELSLRVPRDNKPYRYGSTSSNTRSLNRAIKPEESLDVAERPQATPVEKRCTRCESGYLDRNPYEGRNRYDDRRYRNDYDDRRYDRYDDRGYYDRRPDYDRYDYRDRYDRDRYDRYDRDRYDRDRYVDRYNDRYNDRYDRYNDRGIGYDNRGYDYRERYDRDGYRPWDETYRGSSGFDNNGRGYYFATGRPELGSSNYWGGGGGGAGGGAGAGYASGWNYGSGRDDYRDRGYAGGYPSRPYYDTGYRGVSYLYARPSSSTTIRPVDSNDSETNVTQNPQDNPSG